MVAQNIGFWIIAILMIVSALRVVTTNNVVHAALWLVVVLAGAAGQYILLAAEFVAITQVLVYIGAVMVLFLFGTMLTRARIGKESDLSWFGHAGGNGFGFDPIFW
jgi:NADH-quinone oxidoreductase subunit J